MVAAAAAPAALPILMGASLATTAVGTGLQVKAAGDAYKSQQDATNAELQQLSAGAAEEDRQATRAAEEEKRRIKAGLQTENVNAAQRAAQIRRDLLGVLGTQTAVLASRGVSGGGTAERIALEADQIAGDDLRVNDVNRLTAEGDAAFGERQINTEIRNRRRMAAMGISNAYSNARSTLRGLSEQTGLLQTATLIGGVGSLAGQGADFYRSTQGTRPFLRPSTASVPRGGGTTTGPGGLRGGGV
jgi:hypothetical protein